MIGIVRRKEAPLDLAAVSLSRLEPIELITHAEPAIFRNNQAGNHKIGLSLTAWLRWRAAFVYKQ